MKRTLILIPAILFAAFTAWSDGPAPDPDEGFSPELAAAIRSFQGLKAPSIPDMERRELIVHPWSTAPGRMVVPRHITVDKDGRRVSLTTALGDVLMSVPCCSSRNRGQKRVADDCKTPEGTFPMYGVYNSTDWTYKDTDSKCYGPWFLSIKTPRYWGVGIHGTNAPGSVPGRSSHGCIRLHNENIIRLKGMVMRDTRITVLPDPVTPPQPSDSTADD